MKRPATALGVGAASALFGALAGPGAGVAALLALAGGPLFAALALGTALTWWLAGEPLNRLAPRVLDEQFAGSPVLVTVPLFTLLGYLLAESKTPQRLVRASTLALGWLPGGLALVCLAASAFFTTLTGGSGVTIVAVGGLLLPALLEQRYPERFAVGLVTTGGSLGLLFPPSLPILVYALVAGLDFNLAFTAALLPGLVVFAALAALAVVVGVRAGVPRAPFSLARLGEAAGLVGWELGLPVLLLGGLGTGLFGLDEAAAVGVVYALVVTVLVRRELAWAALPRVAGQAFALAGAVVLILMMANALMNLVVDRQVPTHVLEALTRAGLTERWQFLVVLNVFLFVVGMVMDGVSALIVAVPLVLPLAARFGLSPFHLATMVILNLELAFSSPPLGLNLFIASFRFGRPVTALYRAVLPFVLALAGSLAVVAVVPSLSTSLVAPTVERARAEALARGAPPREAWALECVQVDLLHPTPCTPEDQARWSAPDAGADDEVDDATMREVFGD